MRDVIDTSDVIKPRVSLVGIDGNAFSIMGFVCRHLRQAGNSPEIIERYTEQAMSGDYDHLLRVSLAYTEWPDPEDEEDEDAEDAEDIFFAPGHGIAPKRRD